MKQADRKPTTSMSGVFRFHWNYAKQFPVGVTTSFIAAPLAIIAERYISPLLIAGVLTSIQTGAVTLESSLLTIVIYAALQYSAQLIGFNLNFYALWTVQVKGGRKIYEDAYAKLAEHSLEFYNNTFAGSLVSKVSRLYAAFCSFWAMVIFNLLFATVSIAATLIGIAFISWQLSLVLLFFVALFIYVSYRNTRFMRPIQAARSKAYTAYSAKLSDIVSNMLTVKIDSWGGGNRRPYQKQRIKYSRGNLSQETASLKHGQQQYQSQRQFAYWY